MTQPDIKLMLDKMNFKDEFVKVDGSTISFTFQNENPRNVGLNGTTLDALGKVWKALLTYLNNGVHFRDNDLAITKIDEALNLQMAIVRKMGGHN